MKKIKLGLIGAGNIAQQHLKVIRASDGCEAVGITSRTRSKAEALAQECDIPHCCDNVKELIQKAEPDALMVLVSADQMHKVVSEVIPEGLPLFIEKPAGLTPEENQSLADLAGKHQIKTMVGFNRRYYSVFHKGLKIIQDHGPLVGIFVEDHERMWRIRAGGVTPENVLDRWVYANSTHVIDLLRFFGGEAANVSTIAHSYHEKNGDQFASVMEMACGAIGQFQAHWYSPGGWRVVLYGEGVTVEFKPLEQARWTDKDFKTHAIEPDIEDVNHKPGFYGQLKAFCELVSEGKQDWPLVDIQDAVKTMTLAQAISRDGNVRKRA